MNHREAVALLAPAIAERDGTWADFGAGDGVFTRALAELLGPSGRVFAVDCDAGAVAALQHWAATTAGRVIAVDADFSRPFELPQTTLLDGMLFANSLHFIRDAAAVLARLVAWLAPGGRVVFVEYDRRGANQWVPFPISIARLATLAASVGLSKPAVVATRPSMYGGDLYVAVAERFASG